jgi:hypothetical protein
VDELDVRDKESLKPSLKSPSSISKMKFNWLLLLLIPILILGQGGGRILLEAILLLAVTAIPLQLLIYAVWKLEAMRSVRCFIGRIFTIIPAGFGFSLLVVLGMGLIFAVIVSVRGFVAPRDSWVFVTLGVLCGLMGPILRSSGNQRKQREQGVAPQPAARSESDSAGLLPPLT